MESFLNRRRKGESCHEQDAGYDVVPYSIIGQTRDKCDVINV